MALRSWSGQSENHENLKQGFSFQNVLKLFWIGLGVKIGSDNGWGPIKNQKGKANTQGFMMVLDGIGFKIQPRVADCSQCTKYKLLTSVLNFWGLKVAKKQSGSLICCILDQMSNKMWKLAHPRQVRIQRYLYYCPVLFK